MGNLNNDLEKFLKSDGMRILMESGVVSVAANESLTDEEIENFISVDLDSLDVEELKDLQEKAEDLRDKVEMNEPEDEDSDEYDLWESQIIRIDDFLDDILDRLDEREEE